MARYEHLPIYKQAMDVAVPFEKVVAGFSRYNKYILGTEFRNKNREIVALILEKSVGLLFLKQASDSVALQKNPIIRMGVANIFSK